MVSKMIYMLTWGVSNRKTSLNISARYDTHEPIGYNNLIIEGNVETLTNTYPRT